jgi:outer membrane PBP1 activator LpoA protein
MANTSNMTQFPMIDEVEGGQRRATVAVILPWNSPAMTAAAQAVYAGLQAAHAYDGLHVSLTLIPTDDTPHNMTQAYIQASGEYDLIIGPLSKQAVTLISGRNIVRKPTIVLAHPDGTQNVPSLVDPRVLMLGLPVEEEARQLAYWMQESARGPVVAICTPTAWQRRAAHAWKQQAQLLGMEARIVEIPFAGRGLQPKALAGVTDRIASDGIEHVFVALDTAQAKALLVSTGPTATFYGTSHLNPLMGDQQGMVAYPELDGVRMLDIPWQLSVAPPVVTRYPRFTGELGERPLPSQQRLYALGIDAYLVAQEIAQGRRNMEVSGVTGQLTIAFEAGGATYCQRQYTRASFVAGRVVSSV